MAVYNGVFLEVLRHEGFVVRKLFKIRKNPSIKPLCNYTVFIL
jgi:hypothetical protein